MATIPSKQLHRTENNDASLQMNLSDREIGFNSTDKIAYIKFGGVLFPLGIAYKDGDGIKIDSQHRINLTERNSFLPNGAADPIKGALHIVDARNTTGLKVRIGNVDTYIGALLPLPGDGFQNRVLGVVGEHGEVGWARFSAKANASVLTTGWSNEKTFDGTNYIEFSYDFPVQASAIGNKIRMHTTDGQTYYCVEIAGMGVYACEVDVNAKWEKTPVNKIGLIFDSAVDFSRNFDECVHSIFSVIHVPYNEQEYYAYRFQIPVSDIDVPIGVKFAINVKIIYIGEVEGAT